MILDTGYVHGGDIYSRPIRLDFSANVNPFGAPKTVREVFPDEIGLNEELFALCRHLQEQIFCSLRQTTIMSGCGWALTRCRLKDVYCQIAVISIMKTVQS